MRSTLTLPTARCVVVVGLELPSCCRLCKASIWLFLASASMAVCCCRTLLAADRNELRNLFLNPPPPLPPATPWTTGDRRPGPLSAAADVEPLLDDRPCCCRCCWYDISSLADGLLIISWRRCRVSSCGTLTCRTPPDATWSPATATTSGGLSLSAPVADTPGAIVDIPNHRLS